MVSLVASDSRAALDIQAVFRNEKVGLVREPQEIAEGGAGKGEGDFAVGQFPVVNPAMVPVAG